MIKTLQRRFIRIALVALGAAMILVVLVVNAANWISVRKEMNETLSFLAENSAMTWAGAWRERTGTAATW